MQISQTVRVELTEFIVTRPVIDIRGFRMMSPGGVVGSHCKKQQGENDGPSPNGVYEESHFVRGR
jgi:hypothetical protein